jgi:hypothetical protein
MYSEAGTDEKESGMMIFKRQGLLEKILEVWPPYRKKNQEKTRAAIKWLMEHPEAPCIIGTTLIKDGYGNKGGKREPI